MNARTIPAARSAIGPALELVVMEDGPGPLDNACGRTLIMIEKEIKGSDLKSLQYRHQSGEWLLRGRGDAKRLPNGFVEALVAELSISRTEIKRRMKLAEKYQVSELAHLLSSFATWENICRAALYEKASTVGKPAKKPAGPAFRSKAQTLSRTLMERRDEITPADRRALALLARTITKLLAEDGAK